VYAELQRLLGEIDILGEVLHGSDGVELRHPLAAAEEGQEARHHVVLLEDSLARRRVRVEGVRRQVADDHQHLLLDERLTVQQQLGNHLDPTRLPQVVRKDRGIVAVRTVHQLRQVGRALGPLLSLL